MRALILPAVLAFLATSAGTLQGAANEEEVLMPEVNVRGDALVRPHPQDNTYSERPLGCVEVVTPTGTGNEMGGYHQARFAKEGIPVIPNLNDPTSAAEQMRRGATHYQSTRTPPGQEGKPGCNR